MKKNKRTASLLNRTHLGLKAQLDQAVTAAKRITVDVFQIEPKVHDRIQVYLEQQAKQDGIELSQLSARVHFSQNQVEVCLCEALVPYRLLSVDQLIEWFAGKNGGPEWKDRIVRSVKLGLEEMAHEVAICIEEINLQISLQDQRAAMGVFQDQRHLKELTVKQILTYIR